MPILSNAKKALRSSERKAQHNRLVRAKLKTASDRMKAKPSAEGLSAVFSAIDKAVRRNVVHRNKAARLKSQMSKLA